MWQGGVALNGYLYVIGGVYTTGGATSASTFYASTARVIANASLDLVGPPAAYMSDGGDQSSGSLGGMLTAGNTNIVGTLQVAGQASFNQSATVNGNLNTFGQSVFKTTTNSTTAFQIQNSSGADLLNADTTNAVTDLTNNANNNLVTNGSGEVNATGWAAVGSSGTPAQDTTERYIGTGSIKTTTTAAANDGMKYSLTTSTLVSNTQYTLTLFAKLAPGTTMATFEIGRAENGSTFSQCLTAQTITGAGWTKFNCSFTTGTTSSTPFIYVRQTDATVRTIYVDGVQLTRWSLLANASVEQTLTASDWVKKGNASDAVSKDATQFYDSANSLKIITTANAGDGTKNNITLNDSTYYTLTFQARLDTASAAMATMEAGYSYDGGTTEDACITAQTVVSSGWTSYTCGFTTRSSHSGTPYFYIKQTDGAVHTFYIDAVQLAIGNPLNSAYVEGTISLNGTISSPVALQNQSNSTSAFNVQNSTGNTLLVADTSTMGLTVNSATITATMSVRADATKTVTTAYTTAASSSLTIPNDVTSVTVYSWAAGGGGAAGSGGGSDTAGGNGGGGGYAKAVVSVNPGESLTIEVGTGGAKAGAASKGGNGGGYSAVKRSTTYLVQAGGGGGGGGAQGTVGAGGNGGVGGGATGGNGTAGAGTATNGGLGSGGSASAGGGGGSAGSSGVAGAAGAANVGGEGGGAVTNCSTAVTTGGVGSSFGGPGKGGDQASCDGGGGGGGGAYGGGGGGSATNTGNHAAGGGGGGSDLLTGSSTADASGSGTTHATGDTTAYASCPSTAGNGGSGNKAFGSATAGTDGCVIITYATATNHTSALNVETSAGTDVLRVAANGTTLFKNSGDSNVALQVQNSSGSQVFDVDTTNQKTIAKQNSSSYNSPVMSLQQAGSGDAILEMQDATDGFYLGVNSANAHSFNINSRDALSSSSNIIGEDFTVDPDNFDDSNASSVMATRFTASTTGTISSINVGFNSGTGGALYSVGIFSDNGSPSNCSPNPSCPGTLIGYHSGTAAISAPGGGINWNNLSIIPVSGSSVPVTAGTTYWLAFQTDSSGPDYPNYCNSTTYAAYRSGITGPNLGTWGDMDNHRHH